MSEAGWSPYCGAAPLPAELMGRWNLDPWLLGVLTIAAAAYAFRSRSWPREQRLYFAAAWLILVALFVSPLCALSSALFSVRVAHHLLLAVAAAPLLVLALPRSSGRLNLTLWTGVQAIAFWVWHAPPAYAAALSSDLLYWTMQASLIGSAFAFWSAVRRAPATSGIAALLVSMVQMGLLGALITFAPTPLYAPHLLTTSAWGFSPLEDQQIAGLVMWVPAAGAYLGAALLLMWRYLGDTTQKAAPR